MKWKSARAGRKIVFVFLGVFSFLVLGYVVKVKLRVDLFDDFSVSDYFPFFDKLESNVVEKTKVGVLVFDDFENDFSSSRNWSNLWARETGEVSFERIENEGHLSKCLHLKSESDSFWAYSGYYRYPVGKGDVFRLNVDVKFEGEDYLLFSVASYDSDVEVLKWNYQSLRLDKKSKWQMYRRDYEIGEGVSYVQLRIEGKGRGESWVDDLVFEKLK